MRPSRMIAAVATNLWATCALAVAAGPREMIFVFGLSSLLPNSTVTITLKAEQTASGSLAKLELGSSLTELYKLEPGLCVQTPLKAFNEEWVLQCTANRMVLHIDHNFQCGRMTFELKNHQRQTALLIAPPGEGDSADNAIADCGLAQVARLAEHDQ